MAGAGRFKQRRIWDFNRRYYVCLGGIKTKDYKKIKDLKKENLRDNMTNLELVLNMLAETSTTEISKSKQPKTFPENREVAREGGSIAGNARKQIESKTGRNVITNKNAKTLHTGDNVKELK